MLTLKAFGDLLIAWAGRQLSGKTDNWHIAFAELDGKESPEGTTRGNDNVVRLRHLCFDVDGGDMKPDDFLLAFPNIQMIIFNTASCTKEAMRYRVWIPTSRPHNILEHRMLVAHFISRVYGAGYWTKGSAFRHSSNDRRPSGIDTSKATPCSLFFLPAIACGDPEHPGRTPHSFVVDARPGRAVLEPTDWIRNARPIEKPVLPPVSDEGYHPVRQRTVDNAINEFRSGEKKTGNIVIFRLACRMHWAGMDAGEIKSRLRGEVSTYIQPRYRKSALKYIDHAVANASKGKRYWHTDWRHRQPRDARLFR